ncbi:MAG TPA: hypothetical protein VHM16_08045 [Rubrobacteraceae bacterium]|nr:hypothetical protein [Rubrobacteraceae bacterium]
MDEKAEIDDCVTFHALEEPRITVGDRLTAGDDTRCATARRIWRNLRITYPPHPDTKMRRRPEKNVVTLTPGVGR